MFKLAHISDIHLAPLPRPTIRQLMSKRITGYVNWQKNRAGALDDTILAGLITHMKKQEPDHIVVTGDLVNLSLPEEFSNAYAWLEGLGTPEHVSVILGNHDTYVPGAYRSACRHWGQYMTADQITPNGKIQFPYLRRREAISIIGCNSGVATWPFFATGKFDIPQAKRLATLLKEEGLAGRFRVVMIHHPPFRGAADYYKSLFGASIFRQIITEHGAELILHGHTHINSVQAIPGPNGNVPVIGIPAAGQTPGGRKPAARYNLFSIEPINGAWSCKMQEFGYSIEQEGVNFISEGAL